MYALSFIVVLGIVVFVHELGHFVAARLSGVRVYEFALGFGPRLWSRQVGDTIYAIRVLPLGGMCRLAGMDDSELGDEKVGPNDPSSFQNKPIWKKIFIVVAGPLMNFVLAVAILMGLFGVYGVPMATVTKVFDDSPAERAGFVEGDTIFSVNGKPVAGVAGFVSAVSTNWDRSVDVEVLRDHEHVIVTVVPQYDEEAEVGRIGVGLSESPVKGGVRGTAGEAVAYTFGVVDTTLSMLGAALTGRAKADVSGPIGIAGMSAQAARAGFPSLMMLVALISISLGLLNLMPVPVLDGGWVLLLLIEAIKGRPLSPEFEGALRFIGVALLVLLMVYATVSDISRLIVHRL